MDGLLVAILVYYLLSLLLLTFVLGVASYFLQVVFNLAGKKWLIGAVIVFVIYTAVNMVFGNWVMNQLDITINNQVVADFLGSNHVDLLKTSVGDLVVAMIQIIIGHKVSEKLLKNK